MPVDASDLSSEKYGTNGVNPFDIPAGTPYDDPRISPLTTALFNIGVKMQIGLPPGVLPRNLPPMVTLGTSATDVGLNLYCSQFTVIQNSPPSGWGSPGTWNVWSQPSGTPWYITTEVDLTVANPDKKLKTPYFNSHPDEKLALQRQLKNLSATACSLQQLLFDLDNVLLQDLPQFEAIPADSNAATWMAAFIGNGNGTDPVSQLKDANGVVIQEPATEQTNVSTLDYLCAANNNKLSKLRGLVYSPIGNVFGDGQPLPKRLGLPGGVLPSSIATARYSDPASEFYTFTDLFVINGTTPYRFAPDAQQDSATGQPLVTSSILSGTDQLFAMAQGGVTTLWGANASNEVFYISCQTSQLAQLGFWSAAPVADANLEISADSSTPFYINGLYYVVRPTPVKVPTDKSGTLAIVEVSDDLNAAVLTVSIENDIISYIIDPMKYAFDKIAALSSEDALLNASYPTKTTAGGYVSDLGYALFVDTSVNQDDLQAVASRMTSLKDAWGGVKPPSTTASRRLAPTHPELVPATQFLASPRYKDFLHDIAMAAGDLFQWLKSGVEAIIDLIKDAATNTWHFIAEIAGKVYRAVLDTVDAIVGALEWIFNVIQTAIEQLVDYVKFLFAWDNITRTKDVLYNVSKPFLGDEVDELGEVKTLFDNEVAEVEKTLSQWAGLGDWTPFGDVASNPPAISAASATENQAASSMSFANHFKNNFGQLHDTIDALLNAVSNEGAVLAAVYTKLREVATKITSLSVADAIKQIAVILGEGLLSSVQVVVDALLDVLSSVPNTVIDLLATKIYIPIISDILEAIGVPSISFFDLFAWIGAVRFTLVYKVANGNVPFPDNSARGQSILLGMPLLASPPRWIVSWLEFPTGDNPFSLPGAISGDFGSARIGVSEFLVLPSDPVENIAVSSLSKACTAAGIVSKIIFCGPVQGRLAVAGSGFSSLAVNNGRAISVIVDSILVVPEPSVTGWHFYELSQKPASAEQDRLRRLSAKLHI
ncbi:hypothetical protein F4803DRAFT_557288 [Xylaria telfairii]|nr:hypothetical protein F4803DRAFT_557288 [Xylaria telfairii]